jgi:hypothetical protein
MPVFAPLRILERPLLTLWVGGLWATGFVAAPVLFRNYERMQAGDIAGHLFSAMSYLGMFCGAALLILAAGRTGRGVWRDWRAAVLLVMLGLTLLGEFGLAVRMRELKELAGDRPHASVLWKEFGWLHGISSALFLLESILGLVLVLSGLRPRAAQAGN